MILSNSSPTLYGVVHNADHFDDDEVLFLNSLLAVKRNGLINSMKNVIKCSIDNDKLILVE